MAADASTIDIRATAQLLEAVFAGAGLGDEEYLRWLYLESPFGTVIEQNLEDSSGRAGHYAVIPIALTHDGQPRRGALSLNTAVHERARGGGAFTRLAEATYADAAAAGVDVVMGVANANSTPGFVRRLSFDLLGPLPATMLFPTRPSRVQTERDAAAAVGSGAVPNLAAVLRAPARGLARQWTPETLEWRLRAPGRHYALHATPDAVAISTRVKHRGVPTAVLCAVFTPEPLSRRGLATLVTAACIRHRAPIALHLGRNDNLRSSGRPLPERLRQSPLNLIHRDLRAADADPPHVARWEALDFDAF